MLRPRMAAMFASAFARVTTPPNTRPCGGAIAARWHLPLDLLDELLRLGALKRARGTERTEGAERKRTHLFVFHAEGLVFDDLLLLLLRRESAAVGCNSRTAAAKPASAESVRVTDLQLLA
jgi:hypothetical protein